MRVEKWDPSQSREEIGWEPLGGRSQRHRHCCYSRPSQHKISRNKGQPLDITVTMTNLPIVIGISSNTSASLANPLKPQASMNLKKIKSHTFRPQLSQQTCKISKYHKFLQQLQQQARLSHSYLTIKSDKFQSRLQQQIRVSHGSDIFQLQR